MVIPGIYAGHLGCTHPGLGLWSAQSGRTMTILTKLQGCGRGSSGHPVLTVQSEKQTHQYARRVQSCPEAPEERNLGNICKHRKGLEPGKLQVQWHGVWPPHQTGASAPWEAKVATWRLLG